MPPLDIEQAANSKIPWPAAIIVIIVASVGGIWTFLNVLSPTGEIQLGVPEFYVECVPSTATAVSCYATNSGSAAGSVCFDLVVVCDDGNHVSHTCVDGVAAGSVTTKVVNQFNPALGEGTSCAGLEIQHMAVR